MKVIILSGEYANRTTLLIFADAFSKAYFSKENTPFLYDMAQEGVVTYVEPLFAFRGMETTIFTGVWPSVHNVWTEFCLAQELRNREKDRLLQNVIRCINRLPTDEIRTKVRFFIERYLFRKYYKALNLIPANATPFFESSQTRETAEAKALGNVVTLFDVLRRLGIRFTINEPWILGDRGVFNKARRKINQDHEYGFWYLKFSVLDHMGHKFGPQPSAFKSELKKLDGYIEQTVTLLRRKRPNLRVLVLADHGMSKVCQAVNILGALDHLQSQIFKDYVAFVDSTMIRFWFFTKESRCEILDFLQQIKCGHVLTLGEKRLLKIPLDPKYGETIFVVDEGYVIHPDFFHSKSVVNGMHGYAYPKTSEALPILIMNKEMAETFQDKKQVKFTDISHLILSSIVPNPERASLGLPKYIGC